MDVSDIRALLTVLSFVAFLAIVYWAFGPRSKRRFDDAAQLPFADDDIDARTTLQSGQGTER